MQEYSFLDEKHVIRNMHFVSSVADFAEGVEIVLLINIFSNGYSAVGNVTVPS